MITTKCSGGCEHCPFSNPLLEKLFLPPKAIVKILHQTIEKLAILSGGEPFEHPEIDEILTDLSEVTTPFRIATGGFIMLEPWVDKFKSFRDTAFRGISIGTDVISNRINHSDWVPIWEHNVNLLIQEQIPFSLTFTISSEFQVSRFDIFSWSEIFKGMPEFIYLRHFDEASRDVWLEKIQTTFGKTPLIIDDIR